VVPSFPEYENHDATALAELIRKREVSATEVVEAAIERIEARNPAINAVVARSFERARAQAAAAAQLPDGPFRGVPFLLKDLKALDEGQPVSNGSRLFADYRATADDELVRRFKAAGLVVCGRTNTPEFGILGVTEPELHGATRNPWDLERTCGGSSGGAGAAVAARMVPVAHGSDGGGSIRIPASNCGLFGLKPTRDRIPLLGPDASWGGLATHGVLSRSVRDTAGLLDCLEGRVATFTEGLASPEVPFAKQLEQPPEQLRIALCTDALLANATDPVNVEAAERAAKLCESLGHRVERAKPQFDRRELTRAYLLMVACGTAAFVRGYELERGRKARMRELEPKTWLLKIIGEVLGAGEYLIELGRIRKASAEILQFFANYDVLITPTLAQPPLRVGEIYTTNLERVAARICRAAPSKTLMLALLEKLAEDPLAPNPNTQLFNMTGQPAMSVPLHWSEGGLPIGVQFAGRLGDEGQLLRLARQLEVAQPWFNRRPPLVAKHG
jgi:amidase